jgi:hypothetical protein
VPSAEHQEKIKQLILDASTVPGQPNIYYVGPFAKRVSFTSQQSRALNLIWALADTDRLKTGDRVAVVGAGLAGLMTCAALVALGIDVSLYERHGEELSLQKYSSHRFVHPTINWWPDTEVPLNPGTMFPFFDWYAGLCPEVISEIEREWKRYFRSAIPKPKFGSLVTGVETNKTGVLLKIKDITTPEGPFDIVVIAAGFGEEVKFPEDQFRSYWTPDATDSARINGYSKYVVSGTGDGGLIDALRLLHRNFHNGLMTVQLAQRLREHAVEAQIRQAEHDTKELSDDEATSHLDAAYRRAAQRLPDKLAQWLGESLGNHGKVWLIGGNASPFDRNAAPIHKLLIAHAVNERAAIFRRGRLEFLGDQLVIRESGGLVEPIESDYFVARHGATSSLATFLTNDKIESLKVRQQVLSDRLTPPLWPQKFFRSEIFGYPVHDPTTRDFVMNRLPLAKKLVDDYRAVTGVLPLRHDGVWTFLAQYISDTEASVETLLPEVPVEKLLPETLFGVRVVPAPYVPMLSSVGTPVRFLHSAAALYPGMPIHRERGGYGTIGAILVRNGQGFVLTAAHVVERFAPNRQIIQHTDEPLTVAEEQEFSVRPIQEAISWFPISTFSIPDREECRAVVDELDLGSMVGQRVWKSGASTGTTFGRITKIGGYAWLSPPESVKPVLFGGVIEVESNERLLPFAAHGDSGSLILDDSGCAVGIVIAGDRVRTVVAPISSIMTTQQFVLFYPTNHGEVLQAPIPEATSNPVVMDTQSGILIQSDAEISGDALFTLSESLDVKVIPTILASYAYSRLSKSMLTSARYAEEFGREIGATMARYCGITDQGGRRFQDVWNILVNDPLSSFKPGLFQLPLVDIRRIDPDEPDGVSVESNFRLALMHMLRAFRMATADAEAYEIKTRLADGINPGASLFENVLGMDTGLWADAIRSTEKLAGLVERSNLRPTVLTIGESGYHEERILAHLVRDLFVSQLGYAGIDVANAPWALSRRVVGINKKLNSFWGGADVRIVNRDTPLGDVQISSEDPVLFYHLGYRAFAEMRWLCKLSMVDQTPARVKIWIEELRKPGVRSEHFGSETLPERAWLFLRGRPVNYTKSEFSLLFEFLMEQVKKSGVEDTISLPSEQSRNPDDVFEEFISGKRHVLMSGSIHDLILEDFWIAKNRTFVKILDKSDFLNLVGRLGPPSGGNVMIFSDRLEQHPEIGATIRTLYGQILDVLINRIEKRAADVKHALYIYLGTILTPNHREKWNMKGTDTRWSFAGNTNGVSRLLSEEMRIPGTHDDLDREKIVDLQAKRRA